jgi:uncharacterized membrane protein (DUF4010 family)
MTIGSEAIAGIAIAALGGAAVGVEREWSGHATGPSGRFAGIRTFTLLGGLAGIAGCLWSAQFQLLAVVLAAAAAALVVSAYVAASRRDVDGTTEVAALIVIGAGILAGIGAWRTASGIIAVTTLLLVEKSRLHSLVRRLSDTGLRAGFRFAVMALIVLPLLPEGPYGPLGGIKPRELWMLVLFFSGLSFAGYLARQAVGASQGYVLAGLLGGLISSTNVTFTFSRTSREEPDAAVPLGLGVVTASTILFLRVLIAASVLNAQLFGSLLYYISLPGLAGAVVTFLGLRRSEQQETSLKPISNPLQLMAAIQMAAVFQMVLFAVYLMRQWFGEAGMLVSGAVLGLTDVDALTISMAKSALDPANLDAGAKAIAIGILSNTLLKLTVALVLGAPRFRKIAAAGLGTIAAAGAFMLLV